MNGFEIVVLILLTLNLVITVILWGAASHFYDVLRNGVFRVVNDPEEVRPEDDADWWKRQ